MARIPFIAGNWKMNNTLAEAEALVNELKPMVADAQGVEIAVCPPFTALAAVAKAMEGSNIALGGQGMFWKASGAYTGEVSPAMLRDVGCTHVIVGHSERRGRFGVLEPDLSEALLKVFGDTDESVNAKAKAAFSNQLIPILCVGETLAERQAGQTDTIVKEQTQAALTGLPPEQVATVVMAYEPVWAIGTGETCAADEANRVCGVIRAAIAACCGAEVSEQVRIQYGGSVKPDNAAELLSQTHIDGALVGGASLKAASFAAIVKAAQR